MISYEGWLQKIGNGSSGTQSGIDIGQFEEGHFSQFPMIGERFAIHSYARFNEGIWTSEVQCIDLIQDNQTIYEKPVKAGDIIFKTRSSIYWLSKIVKFDRQELTPKQIKTIIERKV